jgi:hypothetical protein
MAKKTAKKEPAKASAAKATKAPRKPAAKMAAKATKTVKAAKTEKVAEKKTGAAKKALPAKASPTKPALPKAVDKKAAPVPEKQSIVPKAAAAESVVVAEAKPAKPAKPAKMTAAEKKAAKISRDLTMALTEDNKKWLEYQDRYGNERPQKYTMTGQFEAQRPIEHPKFGWGFVISNIEDRLEVLFDSGVRFLISNRKS